MKDKVLPAEEIETVRSRMPGRAAMGHGPPGDGVLTVRLPTTWV